MSFPGAADRPAGALTPLSRIVDRGGRHLAPIVLTIIAVGLAWGGQAVTTRSLPDHLSALDALDRIFPAYKNKREISAALILLGAGGLLLGWVSIWTHALTGDELLLRPVRAFRLASRTDRITWLGAALGVALWAIFLAAPYRGSYEHWLNLVLLAALVLIALPLARRDNGGDWPRLRARWSLVFGLQGLFLLCVIGGFIYLNARDLGSWKYSVVGDEYFTYNYALGIARGACFNPWSHRGAGNENAVLLNAGQALIMRLGAEDNFSWRMHNILIAAASFVPFFFLVRELFRTRIAILATIFLASSHYIFGYSHHGGYLDGLLPTALGLWLLVIGLKRDSTLALFGAGMALAMGFYTFESGRAAVAVAAIFMLTFGPRAFRPPVFVPLAAGFIILVLPLFASDGVRHVLDQMSGASVVDYSSAVTGDRFARFKMNVQTSFVSFNHSDAGRHYVWGSLADPVTAALFVLGLGVALFRIKRGAYRLVMIWYFVEVAFGGFSNPYPMVPVSRLQAVVMPVAVLAAISADAVLQPFVRAAPLRRMLDDRKWELAGGAVLVAVLAPLVLYLNLNRFWYQTPRRYGAASTEAVVMRAITNPPCKGQSIFVIGRAKEQVDLFKNVFPSYRTQPQPLVLSYPTVLDALKTKTAEDFGDPTCVIVEYANTPEDSASAFALVPLVFPNLVRTTLTDLSGYHLVAVYAPPQSIP